MNDSSHQMANVSCGGRRERTYTRFQKVVPAIRGLIWFSAGTDRCLPEARKLSLVCLGCGLLSMPGWRHVVAMVSKSWSYCNT